MQSYFGALPSGDGIPLLEDAHVGQGDVGRTLNVPEPLSQIAIENSSPGPNPPNHSSIALQNGSLFGEEDLFVCGRCKQQFVDLQVFLQHKKEGCVTGHRQLQIGQEHSLPIIQLPAIPNSHFQLERKNTEPFSNPTVLVTPSQGDQPQTISLHSNQSQCTDESLESSNGLNLTQNSQKEKSMSCEVPRDESTFLTDAVHQTGLVVNQVSNNAQARSSENLLLHSNITVPCSTTGENIMLADDILANSSPRQIDFTSDLHLPRFHESEINQQQLNALGMGVLGNGNVTSLLQQIPTQSFAPQQQQQISLCNNHQQQQVYIHIPAPSQTDAQKMFAIQPRDGANQNYALGLNLSSINVTPLTLTTSTAIYTVQDQTAQNDLAAENLSKQIPITPKDGSASHASPKPTGNIDASQNPRVTTKQKPNAKMHLCRYCSRGFPRTYDLEQHIRSHTGEKPFQCIVCGRAFAQKSNVKKHMETHKVWPKQAMDIMPEMVVVSREENGKNSNVEHSVEDPKNGSADTGVAAVLATNARPCPYCNQVLKSYKERKSHMLRHKDKQVYKCVKEGCDQTFPELDDYVEHVKTHEGSMTYRCHHCHKLFDTLQNLGIHQYQAHLNDKSKTGKFGKQYQCKLCPCKFSHPELLQKHMNRETHSHRCAFCKKTFVYERYLRKHINSEHSDKPKKRYKCTECGKMMRSVYYLRTHMRIHTKETPFKCELCPAAFNRKDNLIRHMVIHDPSKKYKCPFRETLGCLKEFNRPDKLKAHIICHNGIRAHKCSFCPKRYTRKSFKTAHEKRHTDEFRCKGCLKGFQNQKTLDQHTCRPCPENVQKRSESRKKAGSHPNSDDKTPNPLGLPDEPMYAIRSGSKRRHLRRDASRVKTSATKRSIGSQHVLENDVPSQDEASTEESEAEIDVEAE